MENENKTLTPKKTFLIIGVALIAQLLVSTLLSWIIFLPMMNPAKLYEFLVRFGPSFTFALTYVPRASGVLIFWFIVKELKVFENKPSGLGIKYLFQIFLITFAFSIFFNVIGVNIKSLTPAGKAVELVQLSSIVSIRNPITILIPVLFAPLLEETVFRKMILDRTKGFGESTAIVFSALCFGLFHQNLTQFMYAFCLGLFLGYVYCKTGKVRVTIIMHILFKGFSAVVMFVLPKFGEKVDSGLVIAFLLVVIAGLAMMISGIVLFIRWLKNRRFAPDNSMSVCIPKKKVLATVYLNPAVISYFAICIFAIGLSLLNIRLF